MPKSAKTLALLFFMGAVKMYKYRSKQISLTDFNTPVGMKLKPDNRWVKKAELIPWDEIEQRYAKLFTNRKGNVAKPLRLALGACIIQAEYGYSDEEVALQIQENAYLQFFCGYTEYNDEKLPFDPSFYVVRRRYSILFLINMCSYYYFLNIPAPLFS